MKRKKKRINILRYLTIIFIIVGFYTFGSKIVEFFSLQSQIKNEERINATLKEQESKLNLEINRLGDKNYLSTYASGRIFATKKGDEIYILEDEDTPE